MNPVHGIGTATSKDKEIPKTEITRLAPSPTKIKQRNKTKKLLLAQLA